MPDSPAGVTRPRLPEQNRILTGALAVAVVALLLLGLVHMLREARLQVVLHADAAGEPCVGEPGFLPTVSALAETPIVPGNAIDVLANGNETFPRLVADLQAARHSITMQLYYGSPGLIADSVLRILAERARAGVLVHFMYDAIGTDRLPSRYRRELAAAGVRVAVFRPFRWHELDRIGHRAHTRAVVIDGLVGYTGGFGLDDKWLGDGRQRGEWRDTNVRFTGPAVAELQGAFVEEWAEATGELLLGDRLFPPRRPDGGAAIAGLMHSVPGWGPSPAERALALSIAGARRTLYISNAYFLPNAGFRGLLKAAVGRGVDVRVLTNSRETDIRLTHLAARAHYEELLADGIRLFEYQPTMMHAKTLVADGRWSSIGTMNFDNRSLALNNETTLLVLDEVVGAVMDSLFREDLKAAREITLDAFRRRSWLERLRERGAVLLTRVL